MWLSWLPTIFIPLNCVLDILNKNNYFTLMDEVYVDLHG